MESPMDGKWMKNGWKMNEKITKDKRNQVSDTKKHLPQKNKKEYPCIKCTSTFLTKYEFEKRQRNFTEGKPCKPPSKKNKEFYYFL